MMRIDITPVDYLDIPGHVMSHVVAASIESERLGRPVRIVVTRGMRTAYADIDTSRATLRVVGGRDIDVAPHRCRATRDLLLDVLSR